MRKGKSNRENSVEMNSR